MTWKGATQRSRSVTGRIRAAYEAAPTRTDRFLPVRRRTSIALFAGREIWPVVRRALLTVLGVQLVLALSLTLVDSWRRRGKKPQPFTTLPPQDVKIGDGTVTTYTFGQDLFDDMLAAIASARHMVLFETYIWKGDEIGERFKRALVAAAERGV